MLKSSDAPFPKFSCGGCSIYVAVSKSLRKTIGNIPKPISLNPKPYPSISNLRASAHFVWRVFVAGLGFFFCLEVREVFPSLGWHYLF